VHSLVQLQAGCCCPSTRLRVANIIAGLCG
jgi:hypothetical protein